MPTSLPHVIARLIVPQNRPPQRPSQPPRLLRRPCAPVADQVGDRVRDRSKGIGCRKGNRTGRFPSTTKQRNHMPLAACWAIVWAIGWVIAHKPLSKHQKCSFTQAHAQWIVAKDIEGSKSNVAMNAWLPQASYPCGNFSDTSSFAIQKSKGSLGQTFQCSDSY